MAVITPYYFAYDDEALRRHYLTVAEAVAPLPVYLYNLPGRAGNAISPGWPAGFAQPPNIAGMKTAAATPTSFASSAPLGEQSILTGAESLALPALRMGRDGVIPGSSNANPEPFVALYRCWRAGDEAGAVAAQARIDGVRRVLAGRGGIATLKAILVARGVSRSAAVRPPMALASVDGAAPLAQLAQLGTPAQ